MKSIPIKEESKKESDMRTTTHEIERELSQILDQFGHKYQLIPNQFSILLQKVASLVPEGQREFAIPVSIFDNDKLGCLEAIVKFFREEYRLPYKEIARLLRRRAPSLVCSYTFAKKKLSTRLPVDWEGYIIPTSVIGEHGLSVLESIVWHLSTKYHLRLREISRVLRRDSRTVWTVLNEAKKKIKVSGL